MIARVVAATPAEAAFLGAAWIAERARAAVTERGRFTIALTGGESPKALHEALAARADVDWASWEVFLGDDRAVPESDPRSNLRNARETLLSKVPVAPERVHAMVLPGADLDAMAAAYEKALAAAAGAPPVLDLVVLGLGKDGHALSLHPGAAAIHERSRDVVALRDPPMDPPLSRVTFTPPMVERARAVLLFAHGASKSAAVRAVLEGPDDVTKTPGQIVRRASGEVLALLDQAAASGLAA